MNGELVLAALFVDRLIGDPKRWIHPVQIIGQLISYLEAKWNRPAFSSGKRRWLGGFMAGLVVIASALITWGIILLAARISLILAVVVNIWLISTTIAWKGLIEAGQRVAITLTNEGLDAARNEVGMIVGRDTANLSEKEVIRATVETLAENLVDGIIAPVIFSLIGQAPLAMAYRAANTLDSMVGYKRERYRDFGFLSAKLDDAFNWIPARVTGIFLLVVLFFMNKNVRSAYRVLVRDARKHPSPNGGIPEAIVAGTLGVRLGGYNSYHGEIYFRDYLGDDTRPLRQEDIEQTGLIINGVVVLVILMLFLLGSRWWRLSF